MKEKLEKTQGQLERLQTENEHIKAENLDNFTREALLKKDLDDYGLQCARLKKDLFNATADLSETRVTLEGLQFKYDMAIKQLQENGKSHNDDVKEMNEVLDSAQ